ncbi:cell division/cell wall cluster transcriptional repressor MraZ [Candidatus Saccharibacteria bacterium]|jgi:division/cell wall cluster transcriptional repressor MraZ|nr:cell division/cell wall cluster transcriptional repressor MraZ [Candidatus Saccharibacteria bacterium]
MAKVDYFTRKLDDKNRLTIPVELRAEFESGVVITKGFGDYLHLYPLSIWQEKIEPELEGSLLDEQVADLSVRFRTGKSEADMDQKQGRVTLKQSQLDFANIEKDIEAIRVGSYFRLVAT